MYASAREEAIARWHEFEKLDDLGLNPYEYRVYSALAKIYQYKQPPKSAKQIAENCGISERKTREVIGNLVRMELIIEYNLSPQELKEIVSNKIPQKMNIADRKLDRCEWCDATALFLEEHHYPVPASKGGVDTVKICPNCHADYHRLESSKAYKTTLYFPWGK